MSEYPDMPGHHEADDYPEITQRTCKHKYGDGRWAIVMHGRVGICAICGLTFI